MRRARSRWGDHHEAQRQAENKGQDQATVEGNGGFIMAVFAQSPRGECLYTRRQADDE
jgi:hypothetical protein